MQALAAAATHVRTITTVAGPGKLSIPTLPAGLKITQLNPTTTGMRSTVLLHPESQIRRTNVGPTTRPQVVPLFLTPLFCTLG